MTAALPRVILGAGGHARVLLALVQALGLPVQGCVAPVQPDPLWPDTVPWLGGDEVLATLDPQRVALVNGVGSVGDPARRIAAFRQGQTLGFRFPALVHPSAVLTGTVTLADGVQIMAGGVVQTGTVIGENTLLNTAAVVDHDGRIGAHCHLAPRSVLSGGVSVGDGAHIGTGAIVIQGITIGAGAMVAAGAVVTAPVGAGQRVAGVPARLMPGATSGLVSQVV